MPNQFGPGSNKLKIVNIRTFLNDESLFRPSEVEEAEYEEFYKAITKDTQAPLGHIHFVAEGEVTFKSLLYIPKVQPTESFNKYGTRTDNIKVTCSIKIF